MAKSKTAKKKNALGTIIAGALALVIVGGAAVYGTGFAITGKANPSEWGISGNTTDTDEPKGTPTDGMTVSTYSSDNLRLRAMPMNASASASVITDSSYYLTATVEPADAWETEIVWEVSFKDPSASWAKGKTASSYVSIAPSSDTLNAAVTCLGGFGEQIIVTASSKDNPAAAATCTCDYVKRAENIVFNFSEISTTQMVYTYEVEPSPYTIDSEISLTSARIEGQYGFRNDITDRMDGNQIFGKSAYESLMSDGFNMINSVYAQRAQLKLEGTNTLKFEHGFYDVIGLTGNYTDDDGNSYSLSSSQMEALRKAYVAAVKASVNSYTGVHATLSFDFEITSNGKSYGSASKSVNINFTYDSIKVPVSTVTLSDSSIIF